MSSLSPAGRRGTLTLNILGTTTSIESSPPEYDTNSPLVGNRVGDGRILGLDGFLPPLPQLGHSPAFALQISSHRPYPEGSAFCHTHHPRKRSAYLFCRWLQWIYMKLFPSCPKSLSQNVLLSSTHPAVVFAPRFKMVGWYALGVALFAAIGTFLFVRHSKCNFGNQAY